MSEPDHPRPPPARPADLPPRGKPTPVRELSGEPPPPAPDADVAEAPLEVDGTTWTVRVLGRSGGASGASPPLLLLGFWDGAGDGIHRCEAMTVGRTLSGLSQDALLEALAEAAPPPDPDRKPPFFPDAGQSRRR